MQDIAETSNFARHASTFLDEDEYEALKTFLALYPDAGVLHRQSRGRLLRWGGPDKGPSAAARVFYLSCESRPLLLCDLCPPRQEDRHAPDKATSARRERLTLRQLRRRVELMITLEERVASVRREINDWSEGKPTNIMVTRYPELDVQGIRERLGMSRDRFAQTFCLDVRALRRWERGEERPAGAAYVLLAVIDKAPEAVLRALQENRKELRRNAVIEPVEPPVSAQGIQIGEARGGLKMLFSLVGAGLLPLAVAAQQANMTETEFRARMVEHETSQDS